MTQEHGQNLGKEAQQKMVRMPSREEILQRLPAGTLGITPQTDAFYMNFVDSIADSEKVGGGLNMAWELAGYDTLRGYPAIVRAGVNISFDRVVDAITPDSEVAEQAKEFRKKVLEEAERERKAKEPKLEDLGPADSLTDFARYSQARRVADIVFEYASGNVNSSLYQIWMQDRRNQGVNPYYNQTHRGFLLEAYYGQLSKLWTPWGQYGFGGGSGSGNWKEVTPVILDRLGAVEKVPVRNTEQGIIGPIYTVHKIDEIVLPDPVERPRSLYVPYEEVDKVWKSLTQQYKQV